MVLGIAGVPSSGVPGLGCVLGIASVSSVFRRCGCLVAVSDAR